MVRKGVVSEDRAFVVQSPLEEQFWLRRQPMQRPWGVCVEMEAQREARVNGA